jgi:hypothetical protein
VSFFERSSALDELAEALLHLAAAALPSRRRRSLVVSALTRLAVIGREAVVGRALGDLAQELPAVLEYAVSRRIGDNFFRELLRKGSDGDDGQSGQAGGHTTIFPVVEIRALGTFEVRVGGRLVQSMEWESERSKELFLLLLANARPMTRDEIVATIWPERGGKRASSVFHYAH